MSWASTARCRCRSELIGGVGWWRSDSPRRPRSRRLRDCRCRSAGTCVATEEVGLGRGSPRSSMRSSRRKISCTRSGASARLLPRRLERKRRSWRPCACSMPVMKLWFRCVATRVSPAPATARDPRRPWIYKSGPCREFVTLDGNTVRPGLHRPGAARTIGAGSEAQPPSHWQGRKLPCNPKLPPPKPKAGGVASRSCSMRHWRIPSRPAIPSPRWRPMIRRQRRSRALLRLPVRRRNRVDHPRHAEPVDQ